MAVIDGCGNALPCLVCGGPATANWTSANHLMMEIYALCSESCFDKWQQVLSVTWRLGSRAPGYSECDTANGVFNGEYRGYGAA